MILIPFRVIKLKESEFQACREIKPVALDAALAMPGAATMYVSARPIIRMIFRFIGFGLLVV
jgi:hypothetical protein